MTQQHICLVDIESASARPPTPGVDYGSVMTSPSAPTIADVEESDTCGDLVGQTGFGSRVLQRRSEIFPLTLSPRPDPKKGRRLSDPGRLLFNTFRAGCDGGEAARSREALLSFPSGKIPDPRLEAIRSLSPTAFEAAGEEGEAAVVVYRSSRSRSIHHPSGGSLLPERLANKRLSLPNTSAIVLPAELGEAMGAVARADGGGSGGLSSPPPLGAAGLLIKDAYGLRRRRSISLECSRLEAILEENSHKQSRKYSLPPKCSSESNDH